MTAPVAWTARPEMSRWTASQRTATAPKGNARSNSNRSQKGTVIQGSLGTWTPVASRAWLRMWQMSERTRLLQCALNLIEVWERLHRDLPEVGQAGNLERGKGVWRVLRNPAKWSERGEGVWHRSVERGCGDAPVSIHACCHGIDANVGCPCPWPRLVP